MAQFIELNQAANQLGIDLNDSIPSDKLQVYRYTIGGIRTMLLHRTDLRQITSEILNVVEADLRAIVCGLEEVNSASPGEIHSIPAAVKNILRARNEIYIALEILAKGDRNAAFFRSLTKCPEYLAEALHYL